MEQKPESQKTSDQIIHLSVILLLKLADHFSNLVFQSTQAIR